MPIKPARATAMIVGPALAAILFGTTPASAHEGRCLRLDTVVSGSVGENGANTAPIHDGQIDGTLNAKFEFTGQTGEVFTIRSSGEIVTKKGSIFLQTTGTLTFTSQTSVSFVADGPVTGGTDRYLNATGYLDFDGTADLAAGTFSEGINGTICRNQ